MDNDFLIKLVRDAYDSACDVPHPEPTLVIDDDGASIWTFRKDPRWVRLTVEGMVKSQWSDERAPMMEELTDAGAESLGKRIAEFLRCH